MLSLPSEWAARVARGTHLLGACATSDVAPGRVEMPVIGDACGIAI